MKPLTIHLPDEVFERAERRAADSGATLPGAVAQLVERYSLKPAEDGGNGSASSQSTFPRAELAVVIQELTAIAGECGLPDWDGQGAAPVNPNAPRNARRLMEALPHDCELPSIGVEPDGHVTLEWYREPHWTLSVSVSPDSDLYYAALFKTADVRGREVFENEVPEVLLGLIRRATKP